MIAQDRLVVDLVYEGGEVAFKERLLPLLGLKALPKVQATTVLTPGVTEHLIPPLAAIAAAQNKP
ncbi:penicillin-binding protein, partial [Thermus scotoductus]